MRRSNALDTESLCIIAGQKCWIVRVDVHLLDYDGGLADASCIAVIAALRHFRRPDVSVEGEAVTMYTPAERTPVRLSMLHNPLCVTISFFHGGEIIVLDATLQEQQMSDGEMIVTANQQGEICQIAKLGGVPTEALILLRCIELATERIVQISRVVDEALKKDEMKQNLGGLLEELRAENQR